MMKKRNGNLQVRQTDQVWYHHRLQVSSLAVDLQWCYCPLLRWHNDTCACQMNGKNRTKITKRIEVLHLFRCFTHTHIYIYIHTHIYIYINIYKYISPMYFSHAAPWFTHAHSVSQDFTMPSDHPRAPGDHQTQRVEDAAHQHEGPPAPEARGEAVRDLRSVGVAEGISKLLHHERMVISWEKVGISHLKTGR